MLKKDKMGARMTHLEPLRLSPYYSSLAPCLSGLQSVLTSFSSLKTNTVHAPMAHISLLCAKE